MKIAPLQNNPYRFHPAQNVNFSSIVYTKHTFPDKKKFNDILELENVKALILHDNKELKRITYSQPTTVLKAFKHLLSSKLYQIRNEFDSGHHSPHEIKKIIKDLKSTPEISSIMISGLYALGAYAYVFQTTNEDVLLKITTYNHFPENRPIEDFDAPVYEQGKMRYGTHYYLTEKLSQNNITQKEILDLCNDITERGFTLQDVHTPFLNKFLVRQFGKDKNGKLYLCDPGCALQPQNQLSLIGRIKRTIKELIREAFNEMN